MMTVMGDALVDGLSDAGSTPARSTKNRLISWRFRKLNGFLFIIKVKEKTAYEPTYLTHGMPVKIKVEKGAWFKVGISMQNNGTEDIEEYVTVEGVTALIE